jgi:hypothetical protein
MRQRACDGCKPEYGDCLNAGCFLDDEAGGDDYEREPWCKDLDGHKAKHEFCADHQGLWCRTCDPHGCPHCVDDPHCPECHCSLFSDYHDWDCSYADED